MTLIVRIRRNTVFSTQARLQRALNRTGCPSRYPFAILYHTMHCMHNREWAEAGARYYRPHGWLGDNFRAWYMTAADWHMAVTAPYPHRPIAHIGCANPAVGTPDVGLLSPHF